MRPVYIVIDDELRVVRKRDCAIALGIATVKAIRQVNVQEEVFALATSTLWHDLLYRPAQMVRPLVDLESTAQRMNSGLRSDDKR